MLAALAKESIDTKAIRSTSAKRSYVAIQPQYTAGYLRAEADFRETFGTFISDYHAELVPDFQYDPERDNGPTTASLDALRNIRRIVGCDRAWEKSRGQDRTVAIVDTGVDPEAAGIDSSRMMDSISTIKSDNDPWKDDDGHGTRSGLIACGTEGIAPDAAIVSCRTAFFDSELAIAYDFLIDQVLPNASGQIIVSNSFGIYTEVAPEPDPDSDFLPALRDALDAGVVVVFSAGNYHELVGGRAGECGPTSIWLYKCMADVLTVAASDFAGNIHDFSSRGPGQLHDETGSGEKPDLCAPVPDHTWGTSGAAPQVAGAAALLASARPDLRAPEIRARLVDTARGLGHERACEGGGQLDCAVAV